MRAPEDASWSLFSDPLSWALPYANGANGQTRAASDAFAHYADAAPATRDDGSYTVEELDPASGDPSGEVAVRFPDAARDARARRYGFVPKGQYQLIVRSYAPFDTFGGPHCGPLDNYLSGGLLCGDYEGDDRGPSTSLGVTSRMTQAVNFSLSGHGAITSNTDWSDPSRGNGLLPRLFGIAKPLNPFKRPEGTADPSSAAVMMEAGREKVVAATMAGAMPLVPKAPDIDVTASARFRQEGDNLIVTGDLHGDAFPNAEVLLRDARGNVILLHSFSTSRGRIAGPLLGLPGANDRPMGHFEKRIKVGKDGSLASRPSRDASKSEGGE